MSLPNPQLPPDPTADYRTYPKGPNFLLIVILAGVAILVILVAALFLVGDKGRQLVPHKPTPTPNSLIRPLLPVPSAIHNA
jgi:hypothetical protein